MHARCRDPCVSHAFDAGSALDSAEGTGWNAARRSCSFFIILYLTGRYGWKAALASALDGAAAPMFFELPFDLILMGRTYPAVPPNPVLYRALIILPLFLVELSTISLLAFLPSMRITRHALYALAGMFAVFAVWAAFGFGLPTEPLSRTLNIVSKMLCFVAAMLFVWRDAERSIPRPQSVA
jgi:hypothetical protein